jgi:type III secretory pathway component EscV
MVEDTRSQDTASDAFASLDFTWPHPADIHGADVWRRAFRLFTAPMAKECWVKWNPDQSRRIEDPRFLEHFRKFLADGLELGYRLPRFQEVSAKLPDPDDGARNWIPFFEQTLAGDDCCVMRMFLSRERHEAFRASPQSETWDKMISTMADGLFYELGLVLRPVAISVDESLASPWFRCEWNDLRLPPQRSIGTDSVLVNDTAVRLALLDIKGEAAANPANGAECAIISQSDKARAEAAGLTTWDSQGYAVLALAAAIRHAAAALVNRSLCELYFLRLRKWAPDLVALSERVMDRDFVVQIVRGLLAEQISVRDLSTILEAALELRATIDVDMAKYIVFPPLTKGVLADRGCRSLSRLMPADYVEFIRARLRRYIGYKYTRGRNTLVVYLMDARSEEVIRQPELDATAEAAIAAAIREEVGSLAPTAQTPVILTTMEVRRRLRRLVSAEFPDLAVVSYQELSPDMNIQPIARISPDL